MPAAKPTITCHFRSIFRTILLLELAVIRREGKVMTYLRPDSKSQVTIEYNDDRRTKTVHTIVVSTQHDDFDAENMKPVNAGEKCRKD